MREKLGTPNRQAGSNGVASPRASSMRAASPARSTTRRAVSSISAKMSMPKNCTSGQARAAATRFAPCRSRSRAPAAGRRRETLDQLVAPQQVVLARQIIEMPLPAIEAVHQDGGAASPKSACEDVEMEAAIDRRTIALAERARQRRIVVPAASSAGSKRPGSSDGSAAVRKISRAPGRAVRVISVHSALSCASVIQSGRRAARSGRARRRGSRRDIR